MIMPNIGTKKVDCRHVTARYRQTPMNTQTSNPPYGLFLCFVHVCRNLPISGSKHRHPPLTRLLSCCKDTIFSRMDNHLSKKKSYLQTKNEFLSLLEAQNEQCNALLPYHGDEHYD